MNIALGQWIATLANQRVQQTGERSEQALSWVQEWVDTHPGAYQALGSPYGTDDDGWLRWLHERPCAPSGRTSGDEHVTRMTANTILIVDDDVLCAQLIDDVLTKAGYATRTATHSPTAFLELETIRPALIVVDIHMPTIDGITFCRMARATAVTRNSPIIIISALPASQDTIPVSIAGFLTKPLDLDALVRLVVAQLGPPTHNKWTMAC